MTQIKETIQIKTCKSTQMGFVVEIEEKEVLRPLNYDDLLSTTMKVFQKQIERNLFGGFDNMKETKIRWSYIQKPSKWEMSLPFAKIICYKPIKLRPYRWCQWINPLWWIKAKALTKNYNERGWDSLEEG